MEERILGELKLDHEAPVEPEAPAPRSFRTSTRPGEVFQGGSPSPEMARPKTIFFWLIFASLLVLCLGGIFLFSLRKGEVTAIPAPTPAPAPVLNNTSKPSSTPLPTTAPIASATPPLITAPIRVPESTATRLPTSTPVASATPKPTATPVLTSSAAWLLRFWWMVPIGLAGLIWFIVRVLRRPRGDSVNGLVDSGEVGVRVSIGETRCLREEAPAEGGLLIADDLKAYAHFNCAFYRLEFSLTMLPDPQRSLDRGEMSLRLLPDNQNARLPFFVRLHPEQEVVVEKRTVKESADGKATFKIPTIGEAEAGGRIETGSDLDVEKVTVTSWGAGEQSGGWRFNATATRSIKTSITGLTALVAIPSDQKAKGQFRAAAHLRSAWKRRKIEPAPETFIEYEFPPTLDVPPVSDAVPAYI